MSEHLSEQSADELNQETYDWDLITQACSWCPDHHIRECSPHLNGCGVLDQVQQALARRRAAADE